MKSRSRGLSIVGAGELGVLIQGRKRNATKGKEKKRGALRTHMKMSEDPYHKMF